MGTKRFLEDLAIGQITKTHTIEVRETEIIEFAERYDPQPLHTNAEFASEGPLGLDRQRLARRGPGDATDGRLSSMGDTRLVGLGLRSYGGRSLSDLGMCWMRKLRLCRSFR